MMSQTVTTPSSARLNTRISIATLLIAATWLGFSQPLSAQTFGDVPTNYWAYEEIETISSFDITGGCGGGNYCPEDPVTRAQMAVFLERSIRGSDYTPPPATGNVFLDVGANDFAAAYIEQFFQDGITGGCGGNNYCPTQQVTRAEMAVFLLRSVHGSSYIPPAPSGRFDDVDLSHWAVAWIEQLAAEGITIGCNATNFCPENNVTRAQMAVFMVRAFNFGASAAPSLSTSTPNSTGTITLTWTYNWGGPFASTENGYSLEESTSPNSGFSEIYSTVNGNDRESPKTYSFSRNQSDTYYYRVRARLSNSTWSDYSNVVSVTVTIATSIPPSAPTGPTISGITENGATLNWTDTSNNETGFQIGHCTGLIASSGGNIFTCLTGFTQIAQVGANVTSYTFTGLSAGTQYTRFVRAYNAAGNSDNTGVRFTTVPEVATRQVTIINQINSGLNLQEVVQVKIIPRFGTFTRSDLLTDDPAQCLSLPGESINRLQSRTFDVDIGDDYEVFIGIGTWDLDNFFCSLGFNWFKRRFFTDPSFQTYYVWNHVIVTGHASDNWNWTISGSYLNGTLVVTPAGGSGIPFQVTTGNPIP